MNYSFIFWIGVSMLSLSDTVKASHNNGDKYKTNDCTPNPTQSKLPITLYPQLTSLWCWAASGEICMGYFGDSISQCDQATNRFAPCPNCCSEPVDGHCVQGGWPEFYKYNFISDSTLNKELSWDQITVQIDCLKRPVVFSWHWISGGGHMMVIIGYLVINGQKYLNVYDPLPVMLGSSKLMPYSVYIAGSDHTHWNDYYNISKK